MKPFLTFRTWNQFREDRKKRNRPWHRHFIFWPRRMKFPDGEWFVIGLVWRRHNSGYIGEYQYCLSTETLAAARLRGEEWAV